MWASNPVAHVRGDDGSVRRELDSQLASNKAESKVNYGVATHAVYL